MSRVAQRPVLAPSPHPKPALGVEEWDSKAPLGDVQVQSVNGLKKACETRKLPSKVRLRSQIGLPNMNDRNLNPSASSLKLLNLSHDQVHLSNPT